MIWAEWVLGGAAVLGAVLMVLLGFRLFRQLKAFGPVFRTASATFADASATLEAVALQGPSRTGGEYGGAAYTRRNPT